MVILWSHRIWTHLTWQTVGSAVVARVCRGLTVVANVRLWSAMATHVCWVSTAYLTSGINLGHTCKRWLQMYWGSTVRACMLGFNIGCTCMSLINHGRKCILGISRGHASVLVINGGCKCMLGINNGCTYTSEINGDHKHVSRIKGGCTYMLGINVGRTCLLEINGGCSCMIGINGCRTCILGSTVAVHVFWRYAWKHMYVGIKCGHTSMLADQWWQKMCVAYWW